jgi:hypothetical protein
VEALTSVPLSRRSSPADSSVKRVSAHTLGLCAFLGLAGAVPAVFCVLTGTHATYASWPLAWIVCTMAAAGYAILIVRGHPSTYQLTFWLFSYVFFGLAPLTQLRTGVLPSTTPGINTGNCVPAFMLVMAGMISFAFGASLKSKVDARPADEVGRLHLNRTRVYAVTAAALVMAWYYIARIGPQTLLTSREIYGDRRTALWPDPTTASLVSGFATAPLLIAIAAIAILRRQEAGERNLRTMLTQIACVGTMLMMVNPMTSPRQVFGTVSLALLAIAGAFSTPRRFRCSALFILIVLVFVFPYADYFRHDTSPGVLAKGNTVTALSNGDYDAFAQVVNTVTYVQQHGSTHGKQALGVALFWVPRQMWPDKPIDTGVLLALDRGYGFTNLSAPLWAEMFINGGWALLVFGMAALGKFARRQDLREWTTPAKANLLHLVIPFYMVILLRGSLLQATAWLSVFVLSDRVIRSKHRSEEADSYQHHRSDSAPMSQTSSGAPSM